MIKDILVNLSYGTSQDGVSDYAFSVAETFGAHIVGTAFAYPVMASGVRLPANFIRAQQAEAQEARTEGRGQGAARPAARSRSGSGRGIGVGALVANRRCAESDR